jgi:hypothetical protein
MKNQVKNSLIVLLFSFVLVIQNANSQTQKHNFRINAFGLRIGSGAPFYILSPSYFYQMSLRKYKASIGIIYTVVESQDINVKEYSVGPKFNFHFAKSGRLDPYVGFGYLYSKRYSTISTRDEESGFQLKVQGGVNFYLNKYLSFQGEISNYRHKRQTVQSFSPPGIGALHPTIGIGVHF